MRQINLLAGNKGETEGALCPEKMQAQGVDMVTLVSLAQNLVPFADFLKEGAGVAVIVRDGKATLMGLKLDG